VEKSMPGFSVGKKEDKCGLRSSGTCVIDFTDVKVINTYEIAHSSNINAVW
jgi:alkylation response protein AidB-like acyl-CoA dehydrogenase